MLVFQPVHSSIRSLAMSVDNFEKQGENILTESSRKNRPSNKNMEKVCISLNQVSLAIQALPLLHLAGYTSPRDELVIGHSAVALPVLLSEVYCAICASTFLPSTPSVALNMRWNNNNAKSTRVARANGNRDKKDEVENDSNTHKPHEEKVRAHMDMKGADIGDKGQIKLWDEDGEGLPIRPKLIKIGFISGKFMLI